MSFVVIVMPVPSAKVSVSSFESAEIVACPETATFLNIHCAEPLSGKRRGKYN